LKKYIGLILELVLYAVLLYFVWHNAHWSVSLTLTLIVLTLEIRLAGTKRITRYAEKRGVRN